MNADKDGAVLTYVETAVLNEGEHIVWKGRPTPGATVTIHLTMPIFGIVFMIFGVAWTSFILSFGIPIWIALPGAAGLVFGARLASPMLINYLKAGRTYYAVTNKRSLIISAGNSITVDSVTGAEIKKLRRKVKPDGTGNVSFRYTTKTGRDQNDFVRTYTTCGFRDGLWA